MTPAGSVEAQQHVASGIGHGVIDQADGAYRALPFIVTMMTGNLSLFPLLSDLSGLAITQLARADARIAPSSTRDGWFTLGQVGSYVAGAIIGGAEVGALDASAEAGSSAMLDMAQQIAKAGGGGWWRTVSVMETAEGETIVGGGGSDLNIAQKELARQFGLTVAEDAPGLHAEETVLQHAMKNGLTPTRGVATNLICGPTCAPLIQQLGGTVSGRFFTFPSP